MFLSKCGFYGCVHRDKSQTSFNLRSRRRYQDTLLAETGNQFYGVCYIEGAVDFIWGQHAHAWFQRSVIASTAAGSITADGPDSSTDSLCERATY